MNKEFDDFKGTKIGVLNDEGKVIGEITVKDVKYTKHGAIFLDEENNAYTEEELNFSYRLTPEYLLCDALCKNGLIRGYDGEEIKDPIFAFESETYSKALKDFMDSMVRSGYIENKNDAC